MPQSPRGLLGKPFQEKAQPCAGSQASPRQRLWGLLETEPPKALSTPLPPGALTLLGFDCTVSAPRWLHSWLRPALLCPAPVCPEARAAALTTSVILRTSGWAAAPPHRTPAPTPLPPDTGPESRAPVPAVPVLLRKSWLPQSETSWSDPGRICLHYCEVLFMKNSEGEGARPRRVAGEVVFFPSLISARHRLPPPLLSPQPRPHPRHTPPCPSQLPPQPPEPCPPASLLLQALSRPALAPVKGWSDLVPTPLGFRGSWGMAAEDVTLHQGQVPWEK